MAAFNAVNPGLAPEPYNRHAEDNTPTTPRPSTAPDIQRHPSSHLDDARTPTRATFGALASQRPLPSSPFPDNISVPETTGSDEKPLKRGDSQYSAKSRDSEDVDMDESDDGQDGSDEEETVNPDGTRSTKKKKTQRFWCTEYPPCNLSFTRSEHLARHIRKHTGERPFQCHCSRRFSRLDNLRQHAQTVHVNEEIPNDSLAATGTRFQRQIRSERIRPPVNRSRASTAGSQTGQTRGHTRNSLSTSSIGSIVSNYSQDGRRRPPPLVMATDPRARMAHENHALAPDSPSQNQSYRTQSPSGYSTPTSATFSTDQSSPRWGSAMQSPITSHSRTASLYAGHRTPGRRLSVPSGQNPFQSPYGSSFGPPILNPQNSSNSALFSPTGSMMASPTSSTSGYSWSRRESTSTTADEAWRRRTWHPETYSNFTSRLINVTTPNYYQEQPAPSNPQHTRLPGIESFDPINRPVTPPQRNPSPMMIDTPSRAPIPPPTEQYPRIDDRRNHSQWDMGLHRNLNRLAIAQGTPPRTTDSAGAWASEANRAVQAQAEQTRAQPTVRFEQSVYTAPPQQPNPSRGHHHRISAPPSLTPAYAKRQGWYHGPVVVRQDAHAQARAQRPSPEENSSSSDGGVGTPGSATVSDYHPAIAHSGTWAEPSQRAVQQGHSYPNTTHAPVETAYSYANGGRQPNVNVNGGMIRAEDKGDSMLRLEALVAVATSEGDATAAY